MLYVSLKIGNKGAVDIYNYIYIYVIIYENYVFIYVSMH